MAVKYRSLIPEVDPDNPQSWARDDITGLPVMVPDMIKQMEYGPQGLYWTGFMVHYKDADEPNPQLVPPRLKPDPVPILNQRFFYRPELPVVPTNVATVTIGATTIELTWDLSVATGSLPAATSYVVLATDFYDESTFYTFEGIVSPPYTITGLASGNTYNIQVAATSENIGTSAFSYPPLLVTTS